MSPPELCNRGGRSAPKGLGPKGTGLGVLSDGLVVIEVVVVCAVVYVCLLVCLCVFVLGPGSVMEICSIVVFGPASGAHAFGQANQDNDTVRLWGATLPALQRPPSTTTKLISLIEFAPSPRWWWWQFLLC